MQALGFNGALHEAGTRWQLLGNGRRAYNPVLMRFHSPDRWSPFGAGGLNAYAYCGGEPVNAHDPTGGFAMPLVMGLVAAASGAAAFAAPSAGGGSGDERSMSPWIVAAIIVGAGLFGVGMLKAGSRRGRSTGAGGGSSEIPSLLSLRLDDVPRRPAIPSLLPKGFAPKPQAGEPLARPGSPGVVHSNELPPPFEDTARQVKQGGPFNFSHSEGETFHNVGGHLPDMDLGYYRSYTVQFRRDLHKGRGTMRLVTGGWEPRNPDVWYFTREHYSDFKRVRWRLPGGELGDRPHHLK